MEGLWELDFRYGGLVQLLQYGRTGDVFVGWESSNIP